MEHDRIYQENVPWVVIEDSHACDPNSVIPAATHSSSTSPSQQPSSSSSVLAPRYEPLRDLSNGKTFKNLWNHAMGTIKFAVSDVNPSSSSSSIAPDDIDISVDDLFIQDSEAQVQKKIDALATKWKELDERVLWVDGRGKRKKKHTQSSELLDESEYTSTEIKIPMPLGLDIYNVDTAVPSDLHHFDVPDEIHDTYYTQLLEILKKVPCATAIDDDFGHSTLETIKLFHLGRKDQNPLVSANTEATQSEFFEYSGASDNFKTGFKFEKNRAPTEKPVPSLIPTQDLISSDELVYTITIKIGTPEGGKLWKIIDCLGSQTLADLTNAINCVNDNTTSDPALDDPSDGETYIRDSYYFIEDELYVEENSPDPYKIANRLYRMKCDQIFKLSRYKSCGEKQNIDVHKVAEIPIKSQEVATLEDLFVQLGKRYLYCHGKEGLCRHLIHFSDMRMFHESLDMKERSRYPRLKFQSRQLKRKCDICEFNAAVFVVFGDRLCVENPTMFCKLCYNMMHYSPHGELLYDDFKIYGYNLDLIS